MASLKLHAILALEKAAKAHAHTTITGAHQLSQKTALFNGTSRDYEPLDDEGERLPSEGNRVQQNSRALLAEVATAEARLFDLIATKDLANQEARANVVIDGTVFLTDVPVTTLLSIEKALTNHATFVKKLPGLDPQHEWTWDEDEQVYKTAPSSKTRSKKVPRNHVKAEATDKHPAQVEVFHEDMVVGNWVTRLSSGGIPERERRAMLTRIEKLAAAIKVAREEANSVVATDVKIGDKIFTYLGWLS